MPQKDPHCTAATAGRIDLSLYSLAMRTFLSIIQTLCTDVCMLNRHTYAIMDLRQELVRLSGSVHSLAVPTRLPPSDAGIRFRHQWQQIQVLRRPIQPRIDQSMSITKRPLLPVTDDPYFKSTLGRQSDRAHFQPSSHWERKMAYHRLGMSFA